MAKKAIIGPKQKKWFTIFGTGLVVEFRTNEEVSSIKNTVNIYLQVYFVGHPCPEILHLTSICSELFWGVVLGRSRLFWLVAGFLARFGLFWLVAACSGSLVLLQTTLIYWKIWLCSGMLPLKDNLNTTLAVQLV